MRRQTLALLAALAAAVLGLSTPAASADDDHNDRKGDNAAIVINTRDDSSRFRLAFDVSRVKGGALENENVAYAYSRCERCRTVAIAVQIVLGSGDPNPISPKNVALAVNDQCTLCVSYADARQFVIVRPEPVELSDEGEDELEDVREDLKELRGEELSPEQLDARIDPLMDEVRQVLATELVAADDGDDDHDDRVTEREATDVAR